MPAFDGLRRWLRLPRPPRENAARDVDEEVSFHLESRARELEAGGRTPAEARAEALREFGDVARARAALVPAAAQRERRRRRRLRADELRQDLRYALRRVRASPGFTLVAVLTLGLGMAAAAAIFSVVNGVLLRPLPWRDPSRLVIVWENDRVSGTVREPSSVPDYYDFRERSHSFQDLAFFLTQDRNLMQRGRDPERVHVADVSHALLQVLGVQPLLGRDLTAADDLPGAPRVVLVAERFWRERLGGERSVIGTELLVDDSASVIVGVVPQELEFPDAGVRIWEPAQLQPSSLPRATHPITVLGRLRPGVALAAAQSDMAGVAARLEQEYARSNAGRGVFVEPLLDVVFARSRPALLVLLGGVGLLLLIACANVANLLLARGVARAREVAVRATLGAGRGRLARQFLVEGLVLALASALVGVVLAGVGLRGLVALLPADMPRADLVSIDVRVLAVAALVSALVGIGFGLLPTLQARRLNLQAVLKAESDRGALPGQARQHARRLLVVAEVAVSVVLVMGAALLVRTVAALRAVDPGFRADHVLRMEVQLPDSRYPRDYRIHPNWPRQQRFYADLLERLARLPGAQSAALSAYSPMAAGFTNSFVIAGREAEVATQPEIAVRAVTANYMRTLRVPVLDGRDLSEGDGPQAPKVALLNQAAVRRFFPDGRALGQHVTFWGATREIVGVVGNEHFYGLDASAPPAIYLALPQAPFNSASILVHTLADPLSLAPQVLAAVRATDPELAVFDIATLDATVLRSIARERSTMRLLGAFALVALLLALIGVHGVLSYTVSQRARELGVRMALGASRGDVLRLVLRQGLSLAVLGVLIGLVIALAGTRLLSGLLWGVSATDAATFAAVALLVLLVAATATWLPARRALRIDPILTLR